MSCPDWQTLCDRRDAESGEPAGWQAAVDHLDDCPECQQDAVAADPALLFRRLPTPDFGVGEIESMQQAVASMRRSAKIEQRRPFMALATAGPWLRAAAVAVVFLGSVMLHDTDPQTGDPRTGDPQSADMVVDAEPSLVAEAPLVPSPSSLAAARSASRLPLVEMANPSYGSIIEVVDQDISVVVVLPGNLDV